LFCFSGGQDSLVELVEGSNRYQTISTSLSSTPFTPNSRFVKQISKWNDTRLQQAEVRNNYS
jgi:hypothetical protein